MLYPFDLVRPESYQYYVLAKIQVILNLPRRLYKYFKLSSHIFLAKFLFNIIFFNVISY